MSTSPSPSPGNTSPLRGFQVYVEELRALVANAARGERPPGVDGSLRAAVDGQAAERLRRLVPLDALRRDGIFLTSSDLAQRAVQPLLPTLDGGSVILDPTCGACDLLLACLRALPEKPSLGKTLRAWERQLLGRDLHPELLEAARQRLLLAAVQRFPGRGLSKRTLERPLFPGIQRGCGLSRKIYDHATHLVMNPPFTSRPASEHCDWASGQVNSAAVFLEHALRRTKAGTRIAAILPDVLRSGSRYRKWRQLVTRLAHVEHLEIGEQFNRWTDIHVFVLNLRVRKQAIVSREPSDSWSRSDGAMLLGDYFEVRVGPVVDYRDPHDGSEHPFIRSRDLPAWGNLARFSCTRYFSGTLITPPFIAVRRTSRPGDRHRAIGTLVTGKSPIAVENHVICLIPLRGGQRRCKAALRALRDSRTTEWLDQRIRCRHLTVRALAQLPWWSKA